MFEINLNMDLPVDTKVDVKLWDFPAGESGIRIEGLNDQLYHSVKINARLQNNGDLIKLFLLTDAARRMGFSNVDLFIPYLPYARQDRVMVEGEPFSLKVITNLLNSQNYRHIDLFDVHSDISTALISNSISIPNHSFVKKVIGKDYLLCSPDSGSNKKIYQLAKYLNYHQEIVFANKIRDVSDGKIIDTRLDVGGMKIDTLRGTRAVIVDDICSRGGTFIALAKKLKEAGVAKVDLIVSHYENTANKPLEYVDHIYTTNSFCDIESDNYITQLKIGVDFNLGE